MKIRLSKSADENIGALRVSPEVFEKLEKLSKQQKVSKQEIIRAILDSVINKVTFLTP